MTPSTSVDETDAAAIRRYKRRCASRAYNERNREARNAKKRERMAALREKQKHDPLLVQAARHIAKADSAQRYREKNRDLLAIKAWAARINARHHAQRQQRRRKLLAALGLD
ncbi:hypothetical protein R3P38DRAFT_3222043 [Favolaschia claudopus]|uniref:Uncharacterized protein n=1 Tax=Favolaschia claudopus TaxID=2862362 RepID=A0AAV9ZZF2_9AGAR